MSERLADMIDHVSIGVSDLRRAARFYAAVLAPLGLVELVVRERTVGYGKRYPEVWLNHRPRMAAIPEDPGMAAIPEDPGMHICLRARTEEMVRAFHAAALAHGGSDDGPPGPRQGAMTAYFAAFIRDPDGNRIEAASFPAAADDKATAR